MEPPQEITVLPTVRIMTPLAFHMPSSRLSSKGQLVIPKEIRDRLRLKAGDRIDFVMDDSGVVRLVPSRGDVRRLSGMLNHLVTGTISIEEMEEAIGLGAVHGEGT
ncbi:MAG: AbrB family looped-hinge helix DNA binding protein [Rhodothermales bacterium]